MSRPLISNEHPIWQNALGVLALVIIVPFLVIIKLIATPFERPMQRSASEVAAYLRDFLQGAGDELDWDDFTCCPIADPALESIRERAAQIDLPLTESGNELLQALIAEAEDVGRS